MLRTVMWMAIAIFLGTMAHVSQARSVEPGLISAQGQNDQGGGLGRTRGQQDEEDKDAGESDADNKDQPPKKPRKDKRDD